MRKIPFFLAGVASLVFHPHLLRADDATGIRLTPVSSRQKLTAPTPTTLDPFIEEPVVLTAGKGEWESFQFVIETGDKPIEKIEIRPNQLVSTRGSIISPVHLSFWRENFVKVRTPSGNKVLQPKWWPDALIPLSIAKTKVGAKSFVVFWATVKVPRTAESGEYSGDIELLLDENLQRLPIKISVENRLATPPTIRANVALYYDMVRDWYKKAKVEFTDEKWAAQKRRYYDFLLDYRLNAYDLPVDWKSEEAGKILRDPRVLSVRVPPLDSPEFEAARAKLSASDTISKAYYYWIDEPSDEERFAQVRDTTTKLRALGIKHLVTAHPTRSLRDAVDIWCPNLGDFFGIGHINAQTLAEERNNNKETWFYTMVEPRSPYPTWLLDDDATAIGDYTSIIKRYNFGGFVYSMCHGWGENPLESLLSFESTNGDGTLIYPSELVGGVGPMPSIRLMLLRDALEDAENPSKPSIKPVAWSPSNEAGLLAGNDLTNPKTEFFSTLGKTNLDGNLSEWQPSERQIFNADGRPEAPSTAVYLRNDSKFLYVGIRAQKALAGDWVGVELAPAGIDVRDAAHNAEVWRFVGTLRGNVVAERHSREGKTRVEIAGFHATIKPFDEFYNVEMQIPLDILGDLGASRTLRFNALRRFSIVEPESGDLITRVTVRAYPDAGDPFLKPLLRLAPTN